MSIRGQIAVVLLACFLIALSVLGLAFLNSRNTDYTLRRVHLANDQLQAMTQLAVASNRHSEQIAEYLALGSRERADLDSARTEMAEALGRLKRLIEEEIALVADPGEKAAETKELEQVDAMRATFLETDRVADQVLSLQAGGQVEAATALFRSRIEGELDDELERMIDAGIDGERREVERTELTASQRSQRLIGSMAALSLLLTAGAMAACYFLYRSVADPLALLTKGAQAIARGDLDHRIGRLRGTEFGFLAQRFDEMSEGLERQHHELLAARQGLERKVVQRTEELHEANRRLLDLDRQRVRFLADASHELRTPLTVLRGEADVALRSRLKSAPFYRDALDRIVAQAEDMSRLVDDLLFLARSESDDVRFEMARVEPAAVVADAVNGIASLARRRDIELRLVTGGDAVGPVTGDPRRLKQAVTILLENAIKYSPPKSRIDVGVCEKPEGNAIIAVRDNGMGIPAGELPRIFDRFFRGEGARTESGGSGLGLTIARSIVEKHGGRIEVTSGAGRGTEARLSLPVSADSA